MRRALLAFAMLLAVASPASGQTVVRLPRYAGPTQLVPATDGSLWIGEQFGAIARLSPTGSVTEFLKGGDYDITDIAAAADGSAWLADVEVLRIDATGATRRFRLDGNHAADAIAGDGDAVWVAEGGLQPRLERIGADGARRTFAVPPPLPGFVTLAIAADGSVWWTSSELGKDSWVGRMTADGRFARWVLPRALRDPGRIVAGSDGAMWFTAARAIGRISLDGLLTSFPVGLVPHDLVAGAGGVWFTSDICLARVDGAGAVTTWPVPGAVRLQGIVPAPGGGFWLADQHRDVIRRFTPAAPAPCGAPTLTRSRGATAATVSFERTGGDSFIDMHVQIARRGKVVYSAAVPGRQGNRAWSNSKSVSVRDLDGDGEPEVMLLLNWNGAHCCSWSRIFRYDRAHATYVAHTHWWGNGGAEPVLRDLNGDRRPEFLSRDDRFSEVFTAYAFSVTPIQIWSYRGGDFRDVTRRYPKLIRRDADKLWRVYLKHRKDNARGILPAWAADEYMLGRAAYADRVLEQAVARGEIKRDEFAPRSPRAYLKAVKKLLRDAGY